jgi:hypothetical protein
MMMKGWKQLGNRVANPMAAHVLLIAERERGLPVGDRIKCIPMHDAQKAAPGGCMSALRLRQQSAPQQKDDEDD